MCVEGYWRDVPGLFWVLLICTGSFDVWILHVRGVESCSGDFLSCSLRWSLFEAGSGTSLLFFLMVFGCVRGRFLERCSVIVLGVLDFSGSFDVWIRI